MHPQGYEITSRCQQSYLVTMVAHRPLGIHSLTKTVNLPLTNCFIRATVSFDDYNNTLIELINRPALSSLRQYTDLTDLLEDYSSTIGSHAGSIIYLSPIYYTKPLRLTFLKHLRAPPVISNRSFFDLKIYGSLFGTVGTSFSLIAAGQVHSS